MAALTIAGCAAPNQAAAPLRFDAEARSPYAWKEEPTVAPPQAREVRFVVLGGTLERRRDAPDPFALHLAREARRVCAGRCDFSVVAGHPLADGGLRNVEDLTLLKRLVAAYAFAGPQFYVIGSRVADTARGVLHALAGWRHTHGTRGIAHFWRTGLAHLGHLWGFDTAYLRGRPVDPRLRQLTGIQGSDGWRIVVGQDGATSRRLAGSQVDLLISSDAPGLFLRDGRLNVGPRGGFAQVTVAADSLTVELFGVDGVSGTARRTAVARKKTPRARWQSLAGR